MNENPDLSLLSDNVDKSQVNDPLEIYNIICISNLIVTNVQTK